MIDPKKIEEWNRLAALTRAVQSVGAPGAEPDSLPVVAAEAIEALLAEREEMLAVLREVEWSATPDDAFWSCPVCEGADPSRVRPEDLASYRPEYRPRIGHAPDCRLAALLKG